MLTKPLGSAVACPFVCDAVSRYAVVGRSTLASRRSTDMDYHDLLSGFVRVHILHHAAEDELYGQWMIEELRHHGYEISPGTLYPMLHAMEQKGYLKSRTERLGRTVRRYYKATAKGKRALVVVRKYLAELQSEAGGKP